MKGFFWMKNKHKINLFSLHVFIYLSLGYLFVVLLSSFLPSTLVLLGIVLYLFVFVLLLFLKPISKQDFSFYVLFPVFLSAFQNVFLGFASPALTTDHVSILLSIGLLYALILLIYLLCESKAKNNSFLFSLMMFFLLIFISFLSLLVYGTPLNAYISSLRNLISPFLYFIIGYLSFRYSNRKSFFILFTAIFMVTIVFGYVQLFIDKDLWIKLNIADLWEKKGIPLFGNSFPVNFISSEFIFGSQRMRMASTFADPVNYGTFIAFSIIYYGSYKHRWEFFLALITSIFVISKGALLSVLLFLVVKSFSKRNLFPTVIIVVVSLFFGIAFITFTSTNSTNSLQTHLAGFFKSFDVLFDHPFGLGVGRVGTLAGLFIETSANDIKESGFGMIVGQLGFLGLVIYSVFFLWIFVELYKGNKFKSTTVNERKFAISLLLAIAANIMFNEVALSPNSNNIYFISIGIIMGNYLMGGISNESFGFKSSGISSYSRKRQMVGRRFYRMG